jgi:CIC family chloride channel protein
MVVPTAGGLLAGLALAFGARVIKAGTSTDFMEAITIGDGEIPPKPTLVRILSSIFTLASGGSIGREGPMVQLAAMLASLVGRTAGLPRARLRLLVACGAASGIASAYNAPIGGALFVAEIVLGSIAMATFGPLVVSSAMATVVSRMLMGGAPLYHVPTFIVSPLELLAYLALGLAAGAGAPLFLALLERSTALFQKWKAPIWAHLMLGGLIVGIISVQNPTVWGNGYGALSMILQSDDLVGNAVLSLLALKLLATATTVGSGAVGGVFTPTLLVGGALGSLFGSGTHVFFPNSTAGPHAYAVVGMGAFLAATTQAPLTAILIVFDMTLNHEIILPLMLACVSAYTVSVAVRKKSIYAAARDPGRSRFDAAPLEKLYVRDLMKPDPICVPEAARFTEIVQTFVKNRHNNLFVVGDEREFRGVIPLHEIKAHLYDEDLAKFAIAQDLLHDDFPTVNPETTLAKTLETFTHHPGERIPVIERGKGRKLVGSISKTDLLLTIAQGEESERLRVG